MAHYAAAADYRLAQLLDSPESVAMLRAAESFFKQHTVVNVERVVGLLAPGMWPTGRVS
jgi:hypothetical protein